MSCHGRGEKGSRPTGAGSQEQQRWVGPRERRGLRATMWAPATGPFCHLKPLGHLLGYLVQPQLRHSGHCLPGRTGGAPGPEARSVACQEIYTRLLTAARHRRRVLGPGWSAVNRPPVSR